MTSVISPYSALVEDKLKNITNWHQLFEGKVDAIRLKKFASTKECAELLAFIVQHPKTTLYNTAAGIQRLGNSFNDARKSGSMTEVYSGPDIVEEALGLNDVLARIFGLIAASWPYGVETFSYKGLPLHRSIGRRIVGGGAEPHDDKFPVIILSEEVPSIGNLVVYRFHHYLGNFDSYHKVRVLILKPSHHYLMKEL